MPALYTIVFPGDEIEHRYADDLPPVGTTIHAHGKNWVVAEVRDDRRIRVRASDDLPSSDLAIELTSA